MITSLFYFTIHHRLCPYFQYPHPGILRKFMRKGAAVSSRNSPRIRSPLGVQRNAAARGGGCAGAGRARRKDGGVPRRAGRGRAFAGTARGGRCTGQNGGRFRRGKPGPFRQAAGRQRGAGGAWPREPHKGRVSGATARGGHVYRAAGRGRYTAAFRGGRGEGAGRAALYGGRAGYSRGGGPIAGARRRRTGKKRSELRGLCRVTGHRWE